jgi:hypothetical protein
VGASSIPVIPITLIGGGAVLTGCANGGSVAGDITNIENQVVAGVQAACQVSPIAEDIAQLVPIYGSSVAAMINAICAAVKTKATIATLAMSSVPGMRLSAPVVVHGVTVHFK